MDLRLSTPLFSAVLAFAIAGKVVLRARKRRMHWLFIGFASNVAVWYLATFLESRGSGPGSILARFTALMAVLLPQTAVRFLRAFRLDAPAHRTALDRWATWLLFPMLALVLSPWFGMMPYGAIIRGAISAYVLGLIIAAVSALYTRSRETPSRQERRRAMYLVGVGVLTALVTTADLVPFIVNRVVTSALPNLGSILVLGVLYMLSEVMERRRIVDLYELAGRFLVLTATALVLAGIYYRLVDWQVVAAGVHRDEGPYFLNAIVASLAILIVFDPLRDKVEAEIGRLFFGERIDFDRAVSVLRHRLAHTLELEALGRVLIEGLLESRRVTSASLYLVDAERKGLERVTSVGPNAVTHLEVASLRTLVELAHPSGAVARDTLLREAEDRNELGETREAERLAECARLLHELHAGVGLPIESDSGDLLGLLTMDDDRVRDAFSQDEIATLRALGTQCAIVIENSRLHARIKERDRLAALGEMAAGLAHEIRNPLGGIKGAAQFIQGNAPADMPQREFLDIIVEEVGRLDRVVRSFLDYARPYQGNPAPLDVNDSVERALKLVATDLPENIELYRDLATDLPQVKMDAEHLRQVLLNLIRNALDAMQGRGTLTVRTLVRPLGTFVTKESERGPELVEIHVKDTGPGIDASIRANLFIPFFTTKQQGTGLGLPICQRLVESVGGRIDVRASDKHGTTFAVVLPTPAAIANTSAPSGAEELSTGEHMSVLHTRSLRP
ncbi:MAG: two-component system sensor protein [Myxococcales bacterium]|nr:two-component system sensor protein [Myxococcales bacterium]